MAEEEKFETQEELDARLTKEGRDRARVAKKTTDRRHADLNRAQHRGKHKQFGGEGNPEGQDGKHRAAEE